MINTKDNAVPNFPCLLFQTLQKLQNAAPLLSRWASMGQETLGVSDPEIMDIITKEKFRQTHGLELIASEVVSLNFIFVAGEG